MDKTKRRTSILKPIKVESAVLNTKPEEQLQARKVRFSSNFVKPFSTEDEKSTIWDTTYEETIGTEESTLDRLTINETKSTTINVSSNKTIATNRTIIFGNGDEMELTAPVPCNSTQYNQTILYHDHEEMEFTQAVSKNIIIHNKNRIPFQDTTLSANDMDMTECLNKTIFVCREKTILKESIQDKENRTILFHDMDGMNLTNVQSIHTISEKSALLHNSDKDKENRTIIFDSDNVEVTQNVNDISKVNTKTETVSNTSKNNRKTILFGEEAGDMELTEQIVPQNMCRQIDKENVPNRKSILVNKTCFENEMEITQCIPTIIKSSENNDGMEMPTKTSASNRKTILFGMDAGGDMELTERVPNNMELANNEEIKKNVSNSNSINMPKSVNSSNNRKTILFDMDTGDMEFTQQLPDKFSTKDTKLEQLGTECKNNILFNRTANNEEIEITQNIPINDLEKSKMNSSNIGHTMLFGYDGGEMEFTQQLPTKRIKLEELTNDHRKTILFNRTANNEEMEITQNIPNNDLEKSKLNSSNSGKTMLFGFDGGEMEFTQQLPNKFSEISNINKDLEKCDTKNRRTMIFNTSINNEEMEITESVAKSNLLKAANRDVLTNVVSDGTGGMKLTEKLPENKNRKTILFNNTINNDAMEITECIPKQLLTKDLSKTSSGKGLTDLFPIKSFQDEQHATASNRKTILFTKDTGDMQLTEKLPNNFLEIETNLVNSKNTNRKTILFNSFSNHDAMEITENVSKALLSENSSKTTFGKDLSMPLLSNILEEKQGVTASNRKTILFSKDTGDMELTEKLPNNFTEISKTNLVNSENANRKTILFNSTTNNDEMEFTESVPKGILSENLSKSTSGKDLFAMLPFEKKISTRESNRKTILFSKDTGDMELTEKLPNNFSELETNLIKPEIKNRKTILFNTSNDAMEMTESVTSSEVLQTIKVNSENINRKTILFNNTANNDIIEITESVENVAKSTSGKDMLTMLSLKSNTFEEKECATTSNRKTILFGKDTGDMELTEKLPNNFSELETNLLKPEIKNRKTILLNTSNDAMDITETVTSSEGLEVNSENINRKTILFNNTTNNDIIEITESVPKELCDENFVKTTTGQKSNTFEEQQGATTSNRRTILFGKDTGDMELTEKLPNNFLELKTNLPKPAIKNRKTILFNTSNDAMEITESVTKPLYSQNISEGATTSNRKTILFGKDTGDMELTEKIPNNFSELERKLVKPEIKKRKTILFNNTTNNDITESVPKALCSENFSKTTSEHNMSAMLSLKSNTFEEKQGATTSNRRTILFGKDTGDMELTEKLPNNFLELKTNLPKPEIKNSKTILFNTSNDAMEITESVTKALCSENFSKTTSEHDMSAMLSLKSNTFEEKQGATTSNRKTILFGKDTGDMELTEKLPSEFSEVSKTNLVKSENVCFKKSKTISFNSTIKKDAMDITEGAPNDFLDKDMLEHDIDIDDIKFTENIPNNKTNEQIHSKTSAKTLFNDRKTMLDKIDPMDTSVESMLKNISHKKDNKNFLDTIANSSPPHKLMKANISNENLTQEVLHNINIDISGIMQNTSMNISDIDNESFVIPEIISDVTLKDESTIKKKVIKRRGSVYTSFMHETICVDNIISQVDMKFKRRSRTLIDKLEVDTDDETIPIPDLISSNTELIPTKSNFEIHEDSDLNLSTRKSNYITPQTSFNHTNFTPQYDDTQHLINYQLSSKKKSKSDLSRLICGDEVPSPLNPNLMPLGQSVSSSFNIDTGTPSDVLKRPSLEIVDHVNKKKPKLDLMPIETINIEDTITPYDNSLVHIINNTTAANLSNESQPSTSFEKTENLNKSEKKIEIINISAVVPIVRSSELSKQYDNVLQEILDLQMDIKYDVKVITSQPINKIDFIHKDNFCTADTVADDFIKYLESNNTCNNVSLHDKISEQAEVCRLLYTVTLLEDNTYLIRTLWNSIKIKVELGDKIHGFVKSYKIKSILKRDCIPQRRLIHNCFYQKLNENQIRASVGNKYSILTLLDYIELNYRTYQSSFNTFERLRAIHGIYMTEDYKFIVEKANIRLKLVFKVQIDFKDINNINENSIIVTPIIGTVVEHDIKRLVRNCQKGLKFIESFNSALDNFISDMVAKL